MLTMGPAAAAVGRIGLEVAIVDYFVVGSVVCVSENDELLAVRSRDIALPWMIVISPVWALHWADAHRRQTATGIVATHTEEIGVVGPEEEPRSVGIIQHAHTK